MTSTSVGAGVCSGSNPSRSTARMLWWPRCWRGGCPEIGTGRLGQGLPDLPWLAGPLRDWRPLYSWSRRWSGTDYGPSGGYLPDLLSNSTRRAAPAFWCCCTPSVLPVVYLILPGSSETGRPPSGRIAVELVQAGQVRSRTASGNYPQSRSLVEAHPDQAFTFGQCLTGEN
jgi:hypothetical protein